MTQKRKDSRGRVLKTGESERKNGGYDYRWRTRNGKRRSIYAPTLEELREKEKDVSFDICKGIDHEARNLLLNDIYNNWKQLKRGLKDNTLQNYVYMYDMFVKPYLGQMHISQMRHSDVRKFYNTLFVERGLKVSTIDNIHTVLHQVLDLAVQDRYISSNPSDNALKELKLMHNNNNQKHHALTFKEETMFLNYLRQKPKYQHWYPIFSIMLKTGLRVGKITGLRWCDIDLENGFISVNHTLVYYNHRKNGCYYNIHTPKTKAGCRSVPIMKEVTEALEQEKIFQQILGLQCNAQIHGYTDFIFINRYGNVHNQGTLNKALRRIIRDCNEEIISKSKGKTDLLLLPRFSCHALRHTFATRLCEAGVNIKVIQDVLGHADFDTTMNIYTEATKDLKHKEFKSLEEFLNSNMKI
ncbi:MAG: tyrosine-type recombinase/integrase [Hominimerdicola sp.]